MTWVRRRCPVGETRRRRRSLLDAWNYLVNKTGPGTERAATRVGPPRRRRRGHSHTAGHVAKNASARAPNERRGAADAEAEGGASSSPRAGRRDSSARDALPQLRQRRTCARRRPSWHRDMRTAPQTRRPRAAPNSTEITVRIETPAPPPPTTTPAPQHQAAPLWHPTAAHKTRKSAPRPP